MKLLPGKIPKAAGRLARTPLFALLSAFLFLGAVLWPGPSTAQTAEMPRDQLVKLLDSRYAEVPVAIGIAQNGGLIEVFTSPGGATWTIILTMPNGHSRVIGWGENWTTIPAARDEIS